MEYRTDDYYPALQNRRSGLIDQRLVDARALTLDSLCVCEHPQSLHLENAHLCLADGRSGGGCDCTEYRLLDDKTS